ncbi:AaceriABR133Wp [[Ashbya] aceris (nom. inval.)]|nr:AaceriABR133Wp [[Ashbya] aceris (nom. inval.)]
MFFNMLRPLTGLPVRFGSGAFAAATQPSLIMARTLMKTHKGAAKRWRKTAGGYKRSKAGRSHGNTGWGQRALKQLSGRTMAASAHLKRLRRLLPYH